MYHICSYCNKTFPSLSNLEKHVNRIHKGIKSHKCYVCEVCFASKTEFNAHICGVHEGKKPYECEYCKACFSGKSNLTCHIKMAQRGESNICFLINICVTFQVSNKQTCPFTKFGFYYTIHLPL